MSAPQQRILRRLYRQACTVELRALKPGNVGLHAAGHRMQARDFMLSAAISSFELARPGLPLGPRIYQAVASTRAAVACNTNLGIVLLCAPLLQAVLRGQSAHLAPASLQSRLRRVLRDAEREDTRWVYRAIRLAAPGGLGHSAAHDVHRDPQCSLLRAMGTAAKRDLIAAQYCNGFAEIFDYAVPRLRAWHTRLCDEQWALTAVYLGLLRRFPDSHVVRKFGMGVARRVSATAARLEAELYQAGKPVELAETLLDVDSQWKRAGINPGTTADLTVATLLAVRLERLLAEGGPVPVAARHVAEPGPVPLVITASH